MSKSYSLLLAALQLDLITIPMEQGIDNEAANQK